MNLNEMRATWRPKLGHDARWLVIGSIVAAFAIAAFKPESAASGITLAGMVFTYVTSLSGIRQWGKNATTSDK